MKGFNVYAGASASAWLLTLMIIAAELLAPFKDLLKDIFGHHWIGKAVVITAVFVLAGLLMKNKNSLFGFNDEKLAWNSVVGSMIIIILFFIIEYFK